VNQSYEPIKEYGPHRGVSSAVAPRDLPPGKYSESCNIRFRDGRAVSLDSIVELWQIDPSSIARDISRCTSIAPYFSDGTDSLFIAVTQRRGYLLDFTGGKGFYVEFPSGFQQPDTLERWSTVSHFSGFYCASKQSGLYRYNGIGGFTRPVTIGPTLYPKYIEVFHGHLVMANILEDGGRQDLRIAWSALDDFTNFVPTSTNEADFFDLESSGFTAASGLGITGIKKIGEALAIYTTDSVWLMHYVGFDNGVMRIQEYVQGTGAWLPYSLVGVDRYHAFIGRDNIYLFDGATFTPIGNDIRKYFYNDLSQVPSARNLTWGAVDTNREEVHWYYIDRNGVTRSLIWNYRERIWFIGQPSDNLSASLTLAARTYNWIDLLDASATTIDGLTAIFGTINAMTTYTFIDYTLFSNSTSLLYREEKTTDNADTVLRRGLNNTYVITRDFMFDDPFVFTEVESMLVDWTANFRGVSQGNNTDGVSVYVSVRDYFGDDDNSALTWEYLFKLTQVQIIPSFATYLDRLSEFRRYGRVFRFKFVWDSLLARIKFNGFAFNRYASKSDEN
jgi:hypothetical protein